MPGMTVSGVALAILSKKNGKNGKKGKETLQFGQLQEINHHFSTEKKEIVQLRLRVRIVSRIHNLACMLTTLVSPMRAIMLKK